MGVKEGLPVLPSGYLDDGAIHQGWECREADLSPGIGFAGLASACGFAIGVI